MVQVLCTVVICAQGALAGESAGRLHLSERDGGLASLSQQSLADWKPSPWSTVSTHSSGEASSAGMEGSLNEIPGAVTPVMEAWVRQDPTICGLDSRAWVEQGSDGIDLPLAALVAGNLEASDGRQSLWLDSEEDCEEEAEPGQSPGSASAVGYVVEPPEAPVLGEGFQLLQLPDSWRLDPGWCLLAADGSVAGEGSDSAKSSWPAIAPGPGVILVRADRGEVVHLSELIRALPCRATSESQEDARPEPNLENECTPLLTVVTGGGDLDACDCSDLQGVIVVDDGSLALDGTVLRGAVFVTHSVDLGETGMIVYREEVLRWATDRSLRRVRLVPGSRREGPVG